MGWTPDQVRACSISDFAAALDGWQTANGAKPDGPDLSDEAFEELDQLMAQYPDD